MTCTHTLTAVCNALMSMGTYIFLSNSCEYMILEVELGDYNRREAYVNFTDCPMDFTCVLYKMLS